MWSRQSGAQVINLSFTSVDVDPLNRDYLKMLNDSGIVLVAAAGNNGPTAPPVYPAAFDFVIATTAIDHKNRSYKDANRGRYVTLAAPGVRVLVLSRKKNIEFSSGTSLAAAHISGLVALLLERNPRLRPSDIRQIIMQSAKDVGDKGHDNIYGAGVADAYSSLQRVIAASFGR